MAEQRHFDDHPIALLRVACPDASVPTDLDEYLVHMKAGDALLFADAVCHGSAKRLNAGDRRISVYRYGSAWNRTRFGHQASPDLLARLNPLARKLVHPRDPIRPPGAEARW